MKKGRINRPTQFKKSVMKRQTLVSVAASLLVQGVLVSQNVHAQDFDFGQIEKFEIVGNRDVTRWRASENGYRR